MMYGQMTAGSWIYIGTQGILQGTYETFAELARQHFGGTLRGRVVLTAGLGGMGGAQPLAVTMNEGVALCDRGGRGAGAAAPRHRLRGPAHALDLDEALALGARRPRPRASRSRSRWSATPPRSSPTWCARGERFDAVTDQTSAHDALGGYVPAGLSLADALALRRDEPDDYVAPLHGVDGRPRPGDARLPARPAPSSSTTATTSGPRRRRRASPTPSTSRASCRRSSGRTFCEGNGPVPLGGAVRRSRPTSSGPTGRSSSSSRTTPALRPLDPRWRRSRCRSRGCRRGSAGSATASGRRPGLAFNELVRTGEVSAPIVIGRDHLDSGSVASPNRETEAMRDGTDAVADWPLLNALVNTAAGATWVSIHHGGGVGIGYCSTPGWSSSPTARTLAARKLERVLTTDPAMGVLRHVDAGYERAIEVARERGVRIPMLERGAAGLRSLSRPWRGPVRRQCRPVPASSSQVPDRRQERKIAYQRQDRADPDRLVEPDRWCRGCRRSCSRSASCPSTRKRIVAFIRPSIRRGRDRLAEADLVDVVDHLREPPRNARRDEEWDRRRRPGRRPARIGAERPDEQGSRRSSGRARSASRPGWRRPRRRASPKLPSANTRPISAGVRPRPGRRRPGRSRSRCCRTGSTSRSGRDGAQGRVAEDVPQALADLGHDRFAGHAAVIHVALDRWLGPPDREHERGRDHEGERVEEDRERRLEEADEAAGDARAGDLGGRPADLELGVALDQLVPLDDATAGTTGSRRRRRRSACRQ